jgi:hypothetical protein
MSIETELYQKQILIEPTPPALILAERQNAISVWLFTQAAIGETQPRG